MKTKIKVILLILCLIAILAIIIFILKNKIAQKNHTYIPENNNSSILEKMKSMTQDELISAIENITDEQLVEIAYGSNKILNTDLHKFDNFSVDFIEGENWYRSDIWLSGSVSSLEEAKKIALDFATSDRYTDYSVEFIGENNLYYQLRVKRGTFAYRMNFYKDSVIKFSKGNSNYYGGKTHYSFSDVIFQKLDYDTVLTIMDLENGNALYRYFEESDKEYIYTQYRITTVGGDWGLNSTVSLKKYVTKIDKNTGTIDTYSSNIKEDITIPNSAL